MKKNRGKRRNLYWFAAFFADLVVAYGVRSHIGGVGGVHFVTRDGFISE
ncbi:MAG: hypothetical protein ACQEWI_20385 [Bacillota bacterium]